ncbi:MAG TPA: hypothetical protein PKM52_03945 [bacterium]|nr:hypothetical protein [bacterium]
MARIFPLVYPSNRLCGYCDLDHCSTNGLHQPLAMAVVEAGANLYLSRLEPVPELINIPRQEIVPAGLFFIKIKTGD